MPAHTNNRRVEWRAPHTPPGPNGGRLTPQTPVPLEASSHPLPLFTGHPRRAHDFTPLRAGDAAPCQLPQRRPSPLRYCAEPDRRRTGAFNGPPSAPQARTSIARPAPPPPPARSGPSLLAGRPPTVCLPRYYHTAPLGVGPAPPNARPLGTEAAKRPSLPRRALGRQHPPVARNPAAAVKRRAPRAPRSPAPQAARPLAHTASNNGRATAWANLPRPASLTRPPRRPPPAVLLLPSSGCAAIEAAVNRLRNPNTSRMPCSLAALLAMPPGLLPPRSPRDVQRASPNLCPAIWKYARPARCRLP
jgi:hypothetical protein